MTKSETLLIDIASIIVIGTATLYLFGLSELYGLLIGYGVTETLLVADVYSATSRGFLIIIPALFLVPIKWLLSFSLLIPVVIAKRKKNCPTVLIYIGIIVFLLSQVYVYKAAGEEIATKHLREISVAFDTESPKSIFTKKVEVLYLSSDKKTENVSGFNLYIPGDYIVIATLDNVVAIKKQNVISIKFKGIKRTDNNKIQPTQKKRG